MISNVDIERKKSLLEARKTPISSPEKSPNDRLAAITEYETQLLASRKFSRYMQRVLKAYSRGADSVKLPLFMPKNFPALVVFRFNSYALQSKISYDYLNHCMFFI